MVLIDDILSAIIGGLNLRSWRWEVWIFLALVVLLGVSYVVWRLFPDSPFR